MLAIIGGTGIYQIDGLDVEQEHNVDTPLANRLPPLSRAITQDKSFCFYRVTVVVINYCPTKSIIALISGR